MLKFHGVVYSLLSSCILLSRFLRGLVAYRIWLVVYFYPLKNRMLSTILIHCESTWTGHALLHMNWLLLYSNGALQSLFNLGMSEHNLMLLQWGCTADMYKCLCYVPWCLYYRHGTSQQGSEISLTSLDAVIKLSSIKSNANDQSRMYSLRALLLNMQLCYLQSIKDPDHSGLESVILLDL